MSAARPRRENFPARSSCRSVTLVSIGPCGHFKGRTFVISDSKLSSEKQQEYMLCLLSYKQSSSLHFVAHTAGCQYAATSGNVFDIYLLVVFLGAVLNNSVRFLIPFTCGYKAVYIALFPTLSSTSHEGVIFTLGKWNKRELSLIFRLLHVLN